VSHSVVANKLVSLASDEQKVTRLEALRTIVTLIDHGDRDLAGLATKQHFMSPLCKYLSTGDYGDVNVIGRILEAIERLLLGDQPEIAKRHIEESHGMAYLEVLSEHSNLLISAAVQRVLSHFKDGEESPGRDVQHPYSNNDEVVEQAENEQAQGSSPPPSKQLFPVAPVDKSPTPNFGSCNYYNMEL
jgi:hypothetical protein